MQPLPPFTARVRSGYTETAERGLRYCESSSWAIRLFVGFMGLAMFCIPVPFVIHAHLGMPMMQLLLIAIAVVVPVLVGLLFLAAAISRPRELRFDRARRQMLHTSHNPLGAREVSVGFDQIVLLDVLPRESEDGAYYLVRLGLKGERPMHLGSFEQREDAEYWRSRIEVVLQS